MNSQYRRDRSQITSHGRGESKKSLRYSDLKSEGGGEGGGGEVHGYSYVRKKYHWIIGEMHLELFSQILA